MGIKLLMGIITKWGLIVKPIPCHQGPPISQEMIHPLEQCPERSSCLREREREDGVSGHSVRACVHVCV